VSRTLSSAFVESVNASETDQAFLSLITISHADLSEPIRVTSDSVETVSNGNTFVPFPFQLNLPKDEDDPSGVLAKIKIDAVDRRVVEAIRQISSPPDFDIQIVLSSDPDAVEVDWPNFKLSNVTYDAQTVEADLVLELLEQEPYPGAKFDPARFPGLF